MFSRKRFVVTRIFVHLRGNGVAPLLGALNQSIRTEEAAVDSIGKGLVDACQAVLDFDRYWYAAANEGEVFRDEGSAGAHFQELQTEADSYFANDVLEASDPPAEADPLTLPATDNVIAIATLAYTGESAALEAGLDAADLLTEALKAAIDLHYQNRLKGVQIHFMPAQLGDELTEDRILEYFPDLIPL